MEILKLLIENPWGTLIVFSSISLLIWVAAKHIANPIDKIGAILKVLSHEANPKTKNDSVEKINWFSILFFAFAFGIELLLFGSGSILDNIIPSSTSKSPPSLCMVTLIILGIITIYSPILIIFTKGDKAIKDKGEEILNK